MNIFSKYGIKEVADVTIYSIIRIDDEEFYIPVLFLDTLKVSTLQKDVETVVHQGGKANGKVISWNFGRGAKLKLTDALFTSASLDMYMNGQIAAKLTDWTSLIAKLTIANKYGMKNYSVKAYPSPILTKKEEEILFRCAEKSHYSAKFGDIFETTQEYLNSFKYTYDNSDEYVAENRKYLIENYYLRRQPTPWSKNIGNYFYEIYDGNASIQIKELSKQQEEQEAIKFYNKNDYVFTRNIKIYYDDTSTDGVIKFYQQNKKIRLIELTYNNTTVYCSSNFVYGHSAYYLFPVYLEKAIGNLCFCDMQDKFYKAMPQRVIDEVAKEIKSFKQISEIDNNLFHTKSIDRMEKCIVLEKGGLEIDQVSQRDNYIKYLQDVQDNYIIYYDSKTMLPFFISDNDLIESQQEYCLKITNNLSPEDFAIEFANRHESKVDNIYDIFVNNGNRYIRFSIKPTKILKLKMGTVYYKWSRTLEKSENIDMTIGTDLLINEENFSGEYRIVGETYMREQKTGKDQRCQFIVKRAKISSSTDIDLKADGDPITFDLDIDVLMPKDKVMIELKQYKVEDDNVNGGTKILPEKRKYTYTPFQEELPMAVIENNEIY